MAPGVSARNTDPCSRANRQVSHLYNNYSPSTLLISLTGRVESSLIYHRGVILWDVGPQCKKNMNYNLIFKMVEKK